MAVNISLALTLGGKDAFWDSKNTGVKLDITHLQFGARNRTTTGEEQYLNQPKQYTTIQNGNKIGPDQIRIMATMPGVENYNVCEIGLWSGTPGQAGSILVAYVSAKTGFFAQMVSGIDLVFVYDMVISTADIDQVNIIKDTDQSSTFSLLAAHETDRNAHPYYVTTDTDQTLIGAKTFNKKAIFSAGLSGELDGNAATATKLKTARKINGFDFDGTADIDFPIFPLGNIRWLPIERAYIPDGELPLDGYTYNRSDYPELWAMVQSGYCGRVVTDAQWLLASGLNRACYSSGDGSTTFRLPDLNGIQTNSFKSPVLRGDGYAASGTALGDAIRNITGAITVYTSIDHNEATGAFTLSDGAGTGESYKFAGSRPKFEFNASNTVPTADENRPNSAFGVYLVTAKGSTATPPSSGKYPTLTGSNTWTANQKIVGNLEVINLVVSGTNNLPLLGYDQTWQDVTASRALSTTYTNSTGKPIVIHVNTVSSSGSTTAVLTVDDVVVSSMRQDGDGACNIGITMIIPVGATYSLASNVSILKWSELR